MQPTKHSTEAFFQDGLNIKFRENQKIHHRKTEITKRRYIERFGIDQHLTSIAWKKIFVDHPPETDFEIRPCHFLWTLMFLQCYELEGNLATTLGVNEKTLRKYKWAVLEHITENSYRFIIWNNRLRQRFMDLGDTMVTSSVDCTDFEIQEPIPFDTKWFSQKFKGPGLRYEIVLSLEGCDIVHANGPFPCGANPDLVIFRKNLKHKLLPDENIIADDGYPGENQLWLPGKGNELQERAFTLIRNRHENMNRLIHKWGCMRQVWRHDREKHYLCFYSVLVITQLGLETQHTLLMHIDEKYLLSFAA